MVWCFEVPDFVSSVCKSTNHFGLSFATILQRFGKDVSGDVLSVNLKIQFPKVSLIPTLVLCSFFSGLSPWN